MPLLPSAAMTPTYEMRRVGIEPTTYTNRVPDLELNPAGIAEQDALLWAANPDRTEPENVTESQFAVIAHGHEFNADPVIYGLVDPRKPAAVRYVGQSKRGGLSRFLGHMSTMDNTPRGRWMRALVDEGVLPSMVLLERCASAAHLTERENVWIYTFKKVGLADCNGPLPGWWVKEHESGKKKQAQREARAQRTKRETAPVLRVQPMDYYTACNVLDEMHGGSEWRHPRAVKLALVSP